MSVRGRAPAESCFIFQKDMNMAVSFSKITDVFGAEIEGVDIAAGVSETAMYDIVDLFNEYSILIFHGQKIHDAQQNSSTYGRVR